MLRKFILIPFLITSILIVNSSFAFAQTQNDWSKVVNSVNSEIAVEANKRKTVFGKLTSANDDEIVIQIADKTGLTGQTETIKKSEIKKIWSAKLNFSKNRGKSAAIGAGAGAALGIGASLILLGATGGSDSTGEIITFGAVFGGGAGAAIGALVGSQRHKKNELLFKN